MSDEQKIYLQPQIKSREWEAVVDQLQRSIDKIPDHQLPKITINLDENKTMAQLQKQLNTIISRLTFHLPTPEIESKISVAFYQDQRMESQRKAQQQVTAAQIKSAQAAAQEMMQKAAASLEMPTAETSKLDTFLKDEVVKLLGMSKDTIKDALKVPAAEAAGSGLTSTFRTRLASSFKAAWPLMAAEVFFDGASVLLDDLIITQEEARQTAEQTRAEYQALQQQIKPLQEALSSTDESIVQLKQHGSLSFVEQKQLDSLQNTRKELQLQLQLQQQLAQSKKARASEAAITYLDQYALQNEQLPETFYNTPAQKRTLLLRQPRLNLFDRVREQMNQVDDYELKKSAAVNQLTSLDENSLAYRRVNQEIERYNELIEHSMGLIQKNTLLIQANKDQLNPFDKKGAEYLQEWKKLSDEELQWSQSRFLNVYGQESFAAVKQELDELAQAGVLDEHTLEGYPHFVKALSEVQISASEACDQIYQLNEAALQIALTPIDQIAVSMADARDAFTTLESVLNDSTQNSMAPETLLALQEQFGNLGATYRDSLAVIADSSSSFAQVQEAVNDLATAYLLNDDALKEVNEDTKAALASMLENLGVTNAIEVAEKAVAAAKMEKAIATEIENSNTYELTESSKNLVYELYNVAAGTAEADRMLKIWEMQKAISMNHGLASFIQNDADHFYNLARAIGIATNTLIQYSLAAAHLGSASVLKAAVDVSGDPISQLIANANLVGSYATKLGRNSQLEQELKQKTKAYQAAVHVPSAPSIPRYSTPRFAYSSPSSAVQKDENLEKYNEELATIKHLRAMDEIDAKNYYQKLRELRDQYLAKDNGTAKDQYISQFRQATEEIHRGNKELFDERMKLSVDYISERKFYDDWGADNEIAALKRVQQWVKEFYEQGIIDYETYIDTKREYDRKLYEAQRKELEESTKKEKEALETKKKGLQSIVEMTVKLIKQEKQEEIDRLEHQIDRYDNLIDAKKESLRLSERELSYEKKLNNHLKDLSKLQAQADLLANDDSREAQAKRAELLDQIAEKQEELNQFQHDDAIEKTEEALDQQKKLFAEEKQQEIKIIKEYLTESGKLVQDAMNRIDSQGDALYQDLVRWNLEYGDGITSTVEAAWNSATEALKEYGTALEAIQKLDDRISIMDKIQSQTLSQEEIITEMKANAAKWHTVSSAEQKTLSQRNFDLGKMLKKYAPEVNRDDRSGIWYWDKERTRPLFHDGLQKGFVGKVSDVKQNEMYALLTKDELVLNRYDQLQIGNRLKMLDLMTQFFSPSSLPKNNISHLQDGLRQNQGITIQVDAPVQISGNADQDTIAQLHRFGTNLARTIGQEFTKKGFHSDITLNTIKP